MAVDKEMKKLRKKEIKRFWALPPLRFSISQFLNFPEPKGFTLLEMMVATGIFSVVIIIAIGAMISLNQAQIKAANIQNIQDNVRFALESMTKEIRTGTQFSVAGCSFSGCTEITFFNEGVNLGYCLSGDVIRRFLPPVDCGSGSPITSDAVSIKKMLFYLVGQNAGPSDGQPRATIIIEAQSRNSALQLETHFNLQTTVTPRRRDIL